MKKIERKVHRMDVDNKSAGRCASEIAIILRGKNKPEFEPHMDCGDVIEVFGIANISFSGKKMDQKVYHHHSGHPGGLKTVKMGDMFKMNPGSVLRKMVKDMLPDISFREDMLKRLIIK